VSRVRAAATCPERWLVREMWCAIGDGGPYEDPCRVARWAIGRLAVLERSRPRHVFGHLWCRVQRWRLERTPEYRVWAAYGAVLDAAAAPPLTAAQRERLALLLDPAGGGDGQAA
jgi:hypothetical protein